MEIIAEGMFGKYRILKELGSGGMGTVCQALDEDIKRTVAVKVLRKRSGVEEARFRREAEVMAKLDHPNIVKIYTMGIEGKSEYLVMEYVDGESLLEILSRGRMARARALQIGEALCKAIGYAHEHGIIHRDLKPGNVLIERNSGRVVVVDFGLAQDGSAMGLTRSGEIIGTLRYMPPEQLRGEKITKRADIYALGAILYEMLTGQYAVPGKGVIDLIDYAPPEEITPMRKHDPSIPEALDRIVRTALAGDAKNRQRNAYALGEQLDVFRKTGTKGTWSRIFLGKKNAAIAIMAVLILIGGIWAGSQYARAPQTKSNRAQQSKIEERMPEGWPQWLWAECWKGEWVDFTAEAWGKQSVAEQSEYASAYQVWYAKKRGRREEETFRGGGAEFEMRLIPPGRFWMGSPDDEADRRPDERRHPATLETGFWMQKTELTQRQWREVTGEKPWSGKAYMRDDDGHAAAYISREDVAAMLAKMGGKWDLPSEAQWEYACRAGTLGRYYWGEAEIGEYANVGDRTVREQENDLWERARVYAASKNLRMVDAEDGFLYVAPVGKLGANAFGLHDMIGNVAEWCRDCYREDYLAPEVDVAPASERVCRGGSWFAFHLLRLRAAYRLKFAPAGRSHFLGARLVVSDAD